jgi:hypothetical protein
MGRGLRHVVVDHHGIGDLDPHSLFLRPLLEAPGDVGLVVPTGPQPLLLNRRRGRFEQDEDGVGSLAANLLGPLEVDLEEDVVPGRWDGHRGSVQVPQEFGRFEEDARVDGRFEFLAIDEDVGILGLIGPTPSRGP